MSKIPFKTLGLASLAILAAGSLNAQTVTDPVGVVKVTIAAAPAAGQTKLTAISATLRNAIAYQSTATSIGSFNSDSAGSPPQPDQPLTQTGAGWTTDQWTTEPHLCYIENAAGAEEAYLIKSHTADTLTLATTFDISSRYTTTPTFRICKANTLGSLFGTTPVPFVTNSSSGGADNLYAWNGSSWTTYWHNGSSWQSPATAFGGNANNNVVFPDEGLFVLRRGLTDIQLTFNGSVPTKPQVSTIPGNGLTFVSSRYPVDVTLNNTNFENLPNWQTGSSQGGADSVYVWNSASNSWITYWHNGTSWQSPATAFGGDANNDTIKADSAMFILRRAAASEENANNTHPIPYNLNL